MRFRCHWTRINRFVSTLSFWYVFDCPHVTASFLVVLGNFGCDVICWIARTGLGTRLRSDRIARYDVSSTRNPLWVSGSTLCAYYKHTHLRYFTTHVVHMRESSFSFRFVFNHFWPSTLIRCVCVSVLINFQERFEIYALSMKTLSVLVWTEGLRASKCHRFQKKTHVSVVFRLKSACFFSHAMPRSGNKDTNAETY